MIPETDFIIKTDGLLYVLTSKCFGYQGEYRKLDDALEAFKEWTILNDCQPELWFENHNGAIDPMGYNGDYLRDDFIFYPET